MKYTNNIASSLLAEAQSNCNAVEIVTAKNHDEEKKRFIDLVSDFLQDGNRSIFTFDCQPAFAYNTNLLRSIAGKCDVIGEVGRDIAKAIKPESCADKAITKILKRRIRETIVTCQLAASILNHDDKSASLLVREKYGLPEPDLKLLAYDVTRNISSFFKREQNRLTAEQRNSLSEMQFEAEGIKQWFQTALDFYGIDDYEIVISNAATCIDVRDRSSAGKPTIDIPHNRKVDGLKLVELIGHEIECHARSSANTRDLFDKILDDSPLAALAPVLAKSDNEILYEGVAKMSDVSVTGESAIPPIWPTIAIDQAWHGKSFADVYAVIYDARLRREPGDAKAITGAWTSTYRAMRGITNTGNPYGYCFSKDYAYLAGFIMASRINPLYHEYSSLQLDEIDQLYDSDVKEIVTKPRFPKRDVVSYIIEKLLKN